VKLNAEPVICEKITKKVGLWECSVTLDAANLPPSRTPPTRGNMEQMHNSPVSTAPIPPTNHRRRRLLSRCGAQPGELCPVKDGWGVEMQTEAVIRGDRRGLKLEMPLSEAGGAERRVICK
jgi:hypothetical protein